MRLSGDAAGLARRLALLEQMGFDRTPDDPLNTEAVSVSPTHTKITCIRPAMGTLVTLTVIEGSRDRAEEGIGHAFQEMERLIDLLNRHDGSSAISCLNREGVIHTPPPELTRLVGRALSLAEVSNDAFDPTVQPLVDLFRTRVGGVEGSAPTRTELLEVLELVDPGAVRIEDRRIRLARSGMGITLDGIAKGYIVDAMAEKLDVHGIGRYLVNAGGDIRCRGHREDGRPWRVGIRDPDDRSPFPDVVEMTNGAVATSGSYEIFYDCDRSYHHLVSSATGSSPQASVSVSVRAPTAATADALATTVFVMGPRKGVAFVETLPRCACLVVERGGRQRASRRWRHPQRKPEPPEAWV